MNNNGPNIDPCGTPLDNCNIEDFCPLNSTYCNLPTKKEEISLLAEWLN